MRLFVVLFLNCVTAIAQGDSSGSGVFWGYNNTDSGRSISISFLKERGKSGWGAGLGMNIRRIAQPDNFNHVYRKRLYPYEPIHFLAYNAFYHKKIFRVLEHVQPFLFYDLQIRYSPTRAETFSPIGAIDSVNQSYIYKMSIDKRGPYYWTENTIGIGFSVELTQRLLFQQKAGLGANLIIGREKPRIYPKRFVEWEAAHIFQFGLIYLFKEK